MAPTYSGEYSKAKEPCQSKRVNTQVGPLRRAAKRNALSSLRLKGESFTRDSDECEKLSIDRLGYVIGQREKTEHTTLRWNLLVAQRLGGRDPTGLPRG
jgi:hypothetical protein